MRTFKTISVICAVSLWSLTAAAQSNDYLWVNKTDGSAKSFALDNLQKITFTDNDIVVTPLDAAAQTFTFAAVQKLTFENSPTAINTPSATSQTSLIYFNSQSKEIVIESEKAIGNVAIYDLTGRVVNIPFFKKMEYLTTINVSHLPAGVYIVKTADSVKKLIINN
jgi:hypothetical protein